MTKKEKHKLAPLCRLSRFSFLFLLLLVFQLLMLMMVMQHKLEHNRIKGITMQCCNYYYSNRVFQKNVKQSKDLLK